MASRDIWRIYDPSTEKLARGEAEGQYRGARVLYSPYIPRSHGTYNIHVFYI